MSIMSAVVAEAVAEGAEQASGLPSPFVFGGFALVVLLALLWITTRINIDR